MKADIAKRRDLFWLCVIGGAALASSVPFFYAAQGQMPEAGDLIIHYPRMLAFDETLRSGAWLPRWLGSMNGGYGAATTIFYAPLLYYALSAAHAVTGDWPKALEVVVALAALGSGVALYACARTLASPGASAVAALFYVLSPYHLLDLYHRGALAELIAFVWMPLVMLAYAKLTKRFSASVIAGGALALALLVLTHPPTAYLFTLAFVVFVIFYAARAKRWQPLAGGLGIVVLGSGLSAFYALPAVIEKPLVNQSVTDLFTHHMGFINELLAGNRFEHLIGMVAVATALLMAALSWPTKRRAADANGVLIENHFAAWKVTAALSLILLLPLVRPLVGALPGMAAVAFVWRWLAIAMLATAMLSALGLDHLFTSVRDLRVRSLAGFAGFLLLGNLIFGMVAAARASNLRTAFVAPADRFEQDFTPSGTPSVYDLPRDKSCELTNASPTDEARLREWQPQRRVIETISSAGGVLHVYTLMYPGWTASVNDSPTLIDTHPNLKTMLIAVPPGRQQVTIIFENTKGRTLAAIISLAALIVTAAMLAAGRLRHHLKRRRMARG
ncbi:MAG: 6-pyruvoyl-tetrahydropterin synthase-related protein [Blastocatellia bacterium]